jgi:hypothetical protein
MPHALHAENIRIALDRGKSFSGPWEVAYDEATGEVQLFHYAHRLAWANVKRKSRGVHFAPRPGYGLSKSDKEGIQTFAFALEIDYDRDQLYSEHHKRGQEPYSEFGQMRPFPNRRE